MDPNGPFSSRAEWLIPVRVYSGAACHCTWLRDSHVAHGKLDCDICIHLLRVSSKISSFAWKMQWVSVYPPWAKLWSIWDLVSCIAKKCSIDLDPFWPCSFYIEESNMFVRLQGKYQSGPLSRGYGIGQLSLSISHHVGHQHYYRTIFRIPKKWLEIARIIMNNPYNLDIFGMRVTFGFWPASQLIAAVVASRIFTAFFSGSWLGKI